MWGMHTCGANNLLPLSVIRLTEDGHLTENAAHSLNKRSLNVPTEPELVLLQEAGDKAALWSLLGAFVPSRRVSSRSRSGYAGRMET